MYRAAPTAACILRAMWRKTGLLLPTVQKVMKVMACAGLVTSVRGACGGYMLSREPISLSKSSRPSRPGGAHGLRHAGRVLRDEATVS